MKIEPIKYDSIESIMHDFSPIGVIGKNLDQYVYRGIGSEEHALIPSACRKEGRELLKKISKIGHNTINQSVKKLIINVSYEIQSICNFYDVANSYGLAVPDNIAELNNAHIIKSAQICMSIINKRWIDYKFLPLMALAQHYVIPTRLLDWSYDIYISLYFAARNCIKYKNNTEDKNFVVWLLNKQLIQKQDDKTKLLFCTPVYNKNPNIAAQCGTFTTISQILENVDTDICDTPLDQYIKNEPGIFLAFDNGLPYMRKLIIPGLLAEPILIHLQKMRYTASRVFPGYSNIIQHLKENVLVFD